MWGPRSCQTPVLRRRCGFPQFLPRYGCRRSGIGRQEQDLSDAHFLERVYGKTTRRSNYFGFHTFILACFLDSFWTLLERNTRCRKGRIFGTKNRRSSLFWSVWIYREWCLRGTPSCWLRWRTRCFGGVRKWVERYRHLGPWFDSHIPSYFFW